MPPTMSPVYIPCEVRDGLFSNEYAVTVRDVTGEIVSFFADRGLVKIEKQTLLRVRFVGEESPARYVVMLPGSAMDAEQRYLRVRADQLVFAA